MTDPVAARTVFMELVKGNYTGSQSVGILSSDIAESDLNPRAVGDHGTAFNLCQWHGDRRQRIRAGCGIDVRSCGLIEAVQACMWELKNIETEAYAAIKRSTTAAQAAAAMCEFYERPANLRQQINERVAIAEHWARVFGVH